MLYIIATPIGNLEDISQRALRILDECDAILSEDTRRTAILMNRYHLKKPLIPYHLFNETRDLSQILSRLESGQRLALVSDAGTPCINDPGACLITACIQRKIPFTTIPGPCSLIGALVLSGFNTEKFQFIGFLPKKSRGVLRQSLFYPGTSIAFESAQRLIATLKSLHELDPTRPLAVVRELTKTFEECIRGPAIELLDHFSQKPPKGEIVLVIGPGTLPQIPLDLEECVELLQETFGLDLKEAIHRAAHLLKIPKRTVYNKMRA